MKETSEILNAYDRYLSSLRVENCQIERNYNAMMQYFNEFVSNQNLKSILRQDCHINMLRARGGKLSQIEKGNFKENENTDSWTPTLYKYFRPGSTEELKLMREQLHEMQKLRLINDEDSWGVERLILDTGIIKESEMSNEELTLECLKALEG